MNKRIARITALTTIFFCSVILAAAFAFIPAGGKTYAEESAALKGELVTETLLTGATESTEAAPEGYNKLYTAPTGKFEFESIDVSSYEKLYFEFKLVSWAQFNTANQSAIEAVFYATGAGKTTKVTLIRQSSDSWNITFAGENVLDSSLNFLSEITVTRSGNDVKELFAGMACGGSSVVTVTELRGVSMISASMVEGVSLRMGDDEGGIRFRAKMNQAAADAVRNGTATMKFVIAPKVLFDTVTDGNYANLSKKIEITVDGSKIYQDGEYYYANGVIANILEENRALDFCATAYFAEGEKITYATSSTETVRGNLYDVVNQLTVLYGDTYAEDILGSAAYGWYGSESYPIVIKTVEAYNALAEQVNGGRDFSAYNAKIDKAVKAATGKTEITKPEFFPQTSELWGVLADECVLKTDCAEGTEGFTEESGDLAEGFEKRYIKTVTGEYVSKYSHKDISRYNTVKFAIRTTANYRLNNFGATDDPRVYAGAYSGWTYWVLTKIADKEWNLKVYFGEELKFDYTRTGCASNKICNILYHGIGSYDFMTHPDREGDSTPYTIECTELRGQLADNSYNNDSSRYTENHRYEATDTQNYMVKNGATEYAVVIPSATNKYYEYAKTELVNFFMEATGIELNVLYGGEQHTPSGKYISLGDTVNFSTSGLYVNKTKLGRDGTRILTKDLSVFITGGSGRGVLYGVYDFLKINFGYEVYYKDCYTLDTGVTELKLKDYNVTDIPDISMRARAGMAFNVTDEENDVMFAYRMRTLDDHNDYIFPIYKTFGDENSSEWSRLHNSSYYIPYETYYAANPKFFSDDGTQLCYTAHGDKDAFEKMTDICAQKAEQSLRYYTPAAHPLMNVIHLGVEDQRTSCDCSSCTAVAKAHNGSNAAAIMIFLNRMGEKVVAWMNEEANAQYKREDLTFSFFVYQNTLTPPFTVNADGTLNVAEDLKPSEGVKIRPYAAFSDLTYYKHISDSVNKAEFEKVEEWSEFVADGWAWTYGCFFRDYFCFYDLYPFYSDYYAKLYKCGYEYSFAQLHSEQRGADTGFYTLANYLTSKLSWDSSLNADELTKNYFEAMYGAAAKSMYEFYNLCRSWFKTTAAAKGWDYNSTADYITSDATCFTYDTVKEFLDKIEEAYAAIEDIKISDPETYEKIKGHIDIEWLFPAKVALTLYQNNFGSAELAEIKTKFKTLCENFGIVKIGESESINSFLNSL